MPIVRIEMLPGRSLAQKRELVRLITDAVCNVRKKGELSITISS